MDQCMSERTEMQAKMEPDSHLEPESKQLSERTKDSGIWQWNQLTWTQLSILA